MLAVLALPFAMQAATMAADEFVCHRKRGLPLWERIGHPIDSLTSVAAYAWLVATRPTKGHLEHYAVLAAISCFFVTKDEAVHATRCTATEHWLHAVLFILHPVVFVATGYLWWTGQLPALVLTQLSLGAAFAVYQLLYWSPL